MTTSNFPPSINLCRLYKKTSAKGSVYFTGRLGGAKITLLKSNETAENGDDIWNLVVSEAPAKPTNTKSNVSSSD